MAAFRLSDGMKLLLCILAGFSFLFLGCKRRSAYIPEEVLLIRVDDSGACFEASSLLDNEALPARVSEYAEKMRLLGKDPERIYVQLDFGPDITYSTARDVELLIGASGVQIDYRGEQNYFDSNETPTPASQIWEEYVQRNEYLPECSVQGIQEILNQRLWLKRDGTLILHEKEVDEAVLRQLAQDRCYLFIEGGDILDDMNESYYELMSLNIVIEPGVRYWDVRRIQHVLSLNSCRLQIVDLFDGLADEAEAKNDAVDDRIKNTMNAIGEELNDVLDTMETDER
ncbi:MAG: hypothetical protein GXY61_05070 [Lentisphaerae bacterium]|nr:hypothetical protein [Lentisphaerota bacterium]